MHFNSSSAVCVWASPHRFHRISARIAIQQLTQPNAIASPSSCPPLRTSGSLSIKRQSPAPHRHRCRRPRHHAPHQRRFRRRTPHLRSRSHRRPRRARLHDQRQIPAPPRSAQQSRSPASTSNQTPTTPAATSACSPSHPNTKAPASATASCRNPKISPATPAATQSGSAPSAPAFPHCARTTNASATNCSKWRRSRRRSIPKFRANSSSWKSASPDSLPLQKHLKT